MDALALTDRDGAYGAVKFAKACASAGIRAIFGVDLAVRAQSLDAEQRARAAAGRSGERRTPARGGAWVDDAHPRITLLAQDAAGWAALCRLVSAVHLSGERGTPIATFEQIAQHAGHLIALLGPDSDVGRAVAARRPPAAQALLRRWQGVFPREDLLVEVVHHRGPTDAACAARLLSFADETGMPAVLTNAVRYADRSDAPTADVLDAARRLVVLDSRHVDRTNAEGYLKSGKEMALLADELAGATGTGASGRRELLARTRTVAERCTVDLGIGQLHFPELGVPVGREPAGYLRERCVAGIGRRGVTPSREVDDRLDDELRVIETLGYPTYFLTVADVVGIIKGMGIRCAARGSGAGSLVNYLLGISDVDPIRYRLLMERFLSPLRQALPDIDVDVESARRTEVYEAILDEYGGERCVCVCMLDTYRARHAIRDVGAALGLPPPEIDSIAKAFPHIRASQVRTAMADLPELRASGLDAPQLQLLFRLVERLDGLPRHVALHPSGVLLSDPTLLDRTPVEASYLGFPMSQFNKDDVEDLGLLKLDVLGIRLQSAMAHAMREVERVDRVRIDVDAIPRDDPAAFALIQSTRTLGCFQIESPGQRELIGKFAPETFDDLIIDISLFRPGPVKSDMVTPFLRARQGWDPPAYPHPSFKPALEETCGVVVFHEQVLRIVAIATGCTLAEADEVRRALGEPDLIDEVRVWFCGTALGRGYDSETTERMWQILKSFGSFGFCKAHAAAFALPTYQSAWLKAHHTAAFLAGVLTHDPGMYPKRLILDDARQFGIAILGLDVNSSDEAYTVERVGVLDEPPPGILDQPPRPAPELAPDARAYGIRIGLADVKGISAAEIARIVAGRPYRSLADFWHRARVSRPIAERLVVAGAFDSIYGIGSTTPVRRRGRVTRRDLLLQVVELDTWSRATAKAARATAPRSGRRATGAAPGGAGSRVIEGETVLPGSGLPGMAHGGVFAGPLGSPRLSVRDAAARQSQAAAETGPVDVQLALDLGDDPSDTAPTGLPEMTPGERVRAELEVLGLDASTHVLSFHDDLLTALGVTRARDLLRCRSRQQVLVAGVKVATQTPPIRSGRRVIFITLDDATGPIDATFFEDAQLGYAATLFHSWLLVVRGTVRRTGPRGISLNADACWELRALRTAWEVGGPDGVREVMAVRPEFTEEAVQGAAESRSTRPVMVAPPTTFTSGFERSPWADIKPAGSSVKDAPRRLWHSSSGSAGG
jgi:error-prone DNA polymerase